MPTPPECPGIEHWQALLADPLPPEEAERCERHLLSCPSCRERLDRAVAGRDELLNLARQVGDPTRAPADPVLAQVVKRLRAGTDAGPAGWSAEATDLYFLRPAERPGVLGLLGGYEVRGVVGRGGMGVVLRAYEPALYRLVAIKVLAPALAGSATARQRFTREAQAAAAVCHEHVVAVYGVDEADGLPYLVMQYVEGESLQERLDRGGPLPMEEVVRIGQQAASGLAAAHKQGLIHRDIKPANLLLEEGDGRVKITDFGLARMTDDASLTQAGVVAGTPEYMAPEQARCAPVDHRADLYSLGSVLYACCTGEPPFRGSTALAVLRQLNDEAPAPLRSRNPAVPAWLETFVARLMAKDAAQRFQSAAEVAALLEGYLAHLRQPATVPPPPLPGLDAGHDLWGTGGRAGVFRRFRRPRLAVACLLLAALLVGGGLLALRLLGTGGGLRLFAVAGGDAAVPFRRLQGHTGPVHNVRFLPDGRLVSGSGMSRGDASLRVWDVATGREQMRYNMTGQVQALDVSADGKFALIGLCNGWVVDFDLQALQAVHILRGHGASVGWVLFAADGRHAFSGSGDGTARMWDLGTGKEAARFAVANGRARGGALLPDGRRLLTGDAAGILQVWDLTTGREVKKIGLPPPAFIDSLSLTPDGRQALITGVGGVRLLDLETGQEVRRFQAENEEVHQAGLSPDGRWLLTASLQDGAVRLWDFRSGELVRELGRHDGYAWTVAFSPDGRLAASGGGGDNSIDHDVRIFELTPDTAAVRPSAGRAWLGAAGVLILLAVLALLGCWYVARRRRRSREEPAAAPAPARQPAPAPASPLIDVHCPGCGKDLKARGKLAGKQVKCPHCGHALSVPGIKAASPGNPR